MDNKNIKKINFTIDESKEDEKNICGITLVAHDDSISSSINKIINKFSIKYPNNILDNFNYHFSDDSHSLRMEILKEISELNINSYSVVGYLKKNISIKKIYEKYFNKLLKPILMKYEKYDYEVFNLNFEVLSDKPQKDKEFILEILSKDIFLKKRIDEGIIIINVIKKENLLTMLPDYIIGVILFFLKRENRKTNSVEFMFMDIIKNKISQVKTISSSDKIKWYDFKKQEGYGSFIEIK